MLLQDNLKVNTEGVRGLLEDLDGLLAGSEIEHFPQVMLNKEGWILEDPALIRLFDRLMGEGTPLGKFVNDRIYMGVKTGLNKAFVIKQDKRDELVEEDARSAEIIKPWLRGRDITRWIVKPHGLYIIFASRGIDIEHYPAIHDHLKWFKGSLEKRATSHQHPWYELQQPQEGIYHEFSAPKILINNVIKLPNFSYDQSGAFASNACFFIVPPTPANCGDLELKCWIESINPTMYPIAKWLHPSLRSIP